MSELAGDVVELQREVRQLRQIINTDRKHMAQLEQTLNWLVEREYDRAGGMTVAAPIPPQVRPIGQVNA